MVKRTIAGNVEFVSARLSRQGAIAICEWVTKGNDVTVEFLVAPSETRAPAEQIRELVQPHLYRSPKCSTRFRLHWAMTTNL